MRSHPPFVGAGNAGPFTLDGTRCYRVGKETAALVDPGPDVEGHVRALVTFMGDAGEVIILLTHRHADHSGAAPALAEALEAEVWGPEEVDCVNRVLRDGDSVATDEGSLIAVHTPGHTRGHLSFHWPEENALFAGDVLLGRGDTTWVAEYPGCVRDYLRSLERLRRMGLDVIYPAHGPAIEAPAETLERFENHRRDRIQQVRRALVKQPAATAEDLLAEVYGGALPARLQHAAALSIGALMEYVRETEAR